jgi:hypothetical protein
LSVAAATTTTLALYGFLTGGATGTKFRGLAPENLSALRSSATRLPHVPNVPGLMTASHAPRAGEVHELGHGALAWEVDGRICSVADHTGGCVDHWPHPIEFIIADRDLPVSGQPSRVLGLATDDVVSVTVELRDGRSVDVRPDRNFYLAQLPRDAAPWYVTGIRAELTGGGTYTERVDLRMSPEDAVKKPLPK